MQHLILMFSPIAAVLFSCLFFKKIRIPESVIVFILGIAFNFGMSEWMKVFSVTDTEYLGYCAISVQYYESWDEWVEETCTDENGQEYDCSHSISHDAWWAMLDNGGHHYSIKQQEYNDIVRYVQGTPVFKELNRDYYRKDGDMYYTDIPLDLLAIPVTRTREYPNRIILNQSLYHYEEISAAEKDSLGLYDYPKIVHYSPHPIPAYPTSLCTYQAAVQGIDNDDFTLPLAILNGQAGKDYGIRTFVFVYPDKSREIAQKQIDYLQLGNFNELLIMLGTQGNEITWCETHSWEDVPELRTVVKQWFTVNNRTDSLRNFPAWYAMQIGAGLWTKKDYHDFDYIRISFSLAQLAGLLAAQLAMQILSFLYIFFFLRRIEKTRIKYDSKYNLTEDMREKATAYMAASRKLMNDLKLTRMEWKIIRENENICNAYYEHERKLKESRKTAIKGYTVCLIMCIPILVSFIPGIITMLSSDDFHADLLVLIIPGILCILVIPVLVASIAVIKRIERREAKRNLYCLFL